MRPEQTVVDGKRKSSGGHNAGSGQVILDKQAGTVMDCKSNVYVSFREESEYSKWMSRWFTVGPQEGRRVSIFNGDVFRHC